MVEAMEEGETAMAVAASVASLVAEKEGDLVTAPPSPPDKNAGKAVRLRVADNPPVTCQPRPGMEGLDDDQFPPLPACMEHGFRLSWRCLGGRAFNKQKKRSRIWIVHSFIAL